MSPEVLFLKGSPSATSHSAIVADVVASEVQRAGLLPVVWSLTDFDPADVLFARAGAPAIARFIERAKSAAALVLASPVYKAAYTGALKAIVDLIPPDALIGRPVLGIATARLPAHSADVDRAFQALFAFFRARALDSLVVLDSEVEVAEGPGRLLGSADERARQAAHALLAAAEHSVPVAANP